MAKVIIGITGAKRAGKNTLAEHLAQYYKLPHDSFADPLREFVARILGYSMEELEQKKEQPVDWLDGITPRKMMQTVGTEWGRNTVHGELWVRSLVHRIPPWGCIVSDVRFSNEAAAIHERGGIIIRVSRPGFEYTTEHASEIPLPDAMVDFEVTNDGPPMSMVAKTLAYIKTTHGPLRVPA